MIRLYDTMAREKREFIPADPARITMYVCGPTVYGRAHIGNARPAVVFDTLARLLRHTYGADSLVYARNVTDVDDKIIAAAKDEGVAPSVITKRFEDFYLADTGALGVAPPTLAPHATAEIAPMVAMIADLVAKGHAYEAQGHVLFSVTSDPDYGMLSRRDREAMLAGARVEVAPYKRDGADFVLWKPSAPDVIGWDSPWGRGRPGWHIECSAMIRAHLGQTIDIHGGGQDLIFPHHENELAQSRCAHAGAPLANYWLHNGFVDMGAEKMSKSLGNVALIDQLLTDGHRGEVLRLALLSAHYRSPLPWTSTLIAQSKAVWVKWNSQFHEIYDTLDEEKADLIVVCEADQRVVEPLRDDLNTPKAIAALHEIYDELREARWGDVAIARAKARSFAASVRLLGLQVGSMTTGLIDEVVDELLKEQIGQQIAARTAAKAARDFATADHIRDALAADDIILEDKPDGTTDWRRA